MQTDFAFWLFASHSPVCLVLPPCQSFSSRQLKIQCSFYIYAYKAQLCCVTKHKAENTCILRMSMDLGVFSSHTTVTKQKCLSHFFALLCCWFEDHNTNKKQFNYTRVKKVYRDHGGLLPHGWAGQDNEKSLAGINFFFVAFCIISCSIWVHLTGKMSLVTLRGYSAGAVCVCVS